jgi:3'-phosphoadenosine 5'-phosphosulfate sulfotransferase (PAPS reductase)/FAD synthetase
MMAQRYFSFGGGVQSTAVLVLAVQGRVQYDAFLFANVGNDSENPATIEYVERVAKPYAAANGVELVELHKTTRGQPETLLQYAHRTQRSIPIPAYMGSGAPGNRTCTSDFKIDVIARYQKQHGATPAAPCITGLGISMDEIQRARTDSGIAWQVLDYPLLDLRMYRRACADTSWCTRRRPMR